MKQTRRFVIEPFFLLLIVSVILPITVSESVSSHTVYVGGTGTGNFTRIQDALDNAPVGSTVYVYPGMYHETLRITTPVRLIGGDTNSTVIDGDNNSYVITLAAGNSTLSGFTIIRSKQKFPFAGVYIISDHNIVSQNILTENFYGMHLGYATSHNLVANNTIHDNGRCGIYFNHASCNILRENVIFDQPVNGFGLFEFSNSNIILNNTFFDNRNTGVNIRESYDNKVENNIFTSGNIGLHLPAPEYHTVDSDNDFSKNTISLEEERDAFVLTVIVFDISVFFVFLTFRKLNR